MATFRLTMVSTSTAIGLPYGSIPRLMLAFIGGRGYARQVNRRELILGRQHERHSMIELGMIS